MRGSFGGADGGADGGANGGGTDGGTDGGVSGGVRGGTTGGGEGGGELGGGGGGGGELGGVTGVGGVSGGSLGGGGEGGAVGAPGASGDGGTPGGRLGGLTGGPLGGTEGGGGCSALAMHHTVLCPGDDTKEKLRCDNGGVIHINRHGATYGRKDVGPNSIQCPGDTLTGRSKPAGNAGNVDNILEPRCNGKKECEFIVSDDSLWAGAPEVDKYLEVSFRCI